MLSSAVVVFSSGRDTECHWTILVLVKLGVRLVSSVLFSFALTLGMSFSEAVVFTLNSVTLLGSELNA